MISDNYYIKFLDSKSTIEIKPNTINNETTLALFGRSSTDWGKLLNQNFLKLLDNFNNDYEPGYNNQVLEGQLWFDSATKQLKLCIDPIFLTWDVICNAEFNTIENYVTKDILNNTLSDYINISGNTKKMTGPLLLTVSSNDNALATKRYVKDRVCACLYAGDSSMDGYLKNTGDTTTNIIHVPEMYYTSHTAAYKSYVDNKSIFKHTTDTNITITGGITNVNDLISYTTESLNEKLMTISGHFKFPINETEATISWNTPFVGDYTCLVSSSIFQYTPNDPNSGKTNNISYTIVDDKSISISRIISSVDEIINIMINGMISSETNSST
jgi:hypothetical protein